MARRVVTTVVDDLDGSPGGQTVRFGIDRAAYEIDLSPENAERLRHALEPFLTRARRVAGEPVPAAPALTATHIVRTSITPSRQPARVDPEQLRAIRRWASAHGFHVPPRGRIPEAVIQAYNQVPAPV